MAFPVQKLVIGAVLALLLAAPANAQFGAPIDERTTVVKGLVVKGFGGPPWWIVSKGEAKVYVLGAPSNVPPGFFFDRRLIELRVKGAERVILSPNVEFWSIGAFALPQSKRLIAETNGEGAIGLEATLPDDLRVRFQTARQSIHRPEERYGALPPGLAGMVLAADVEAVRAPYGAMASRPVEVIVTEIARKARVRVAPARTYGRDTMAAILDDARKPDLACLAASLDRIERPPRPARAQPSPVVQAWAEGDIAPLLDSLRQNAGQRSSMVSLQRGDQTIRLRMGEPACIAQMPAVRDLQTRFVSDQVDAIAEALTRRGHSVAVVDAGALLMTGGVLDQLRQRGFEIKTPDVAATE